MTEPKWHPSIEDMGFFDSHMRCPRCYKKMVTTPGTNAEGEEWALHECWNCEHKESGPLYLSGR